jgi:hypothetical protein
VTTTTADVKSEFIYPAYSYNKEQFWNSYKEQVAWHADIPKILPHTTCGFDFANTKLTIALYFCSEYLVAHHHRRSGTMEGLESSVSSTHQKHNA